MVRQNWYKGVQPFGRVPPRRRNTRGIFRRREISGGTGRFVPAAAAAYRRSAYPNALMRYGIMRRIGGYRGLMRRELYGRRKR